MAAPPPIDWSQLTGSGKKKTKKKPPLTPAQRAANDVANKQARTKAYAAAGLNPYVAIRHGRLVVVKNPANAIHYQGQPQTRTQVLSAYQHFNDTWLSYLGRPITEKEFQHFTNNGWSMYQIQHNYLMHRPNFTKGPLYKQASGTYIDAWHQVYGEDSTPDPKAIRLGVVGNMSTSAFADALRKRPDYVKSNEFQTNDAQLSTVYTKIFGIPDMRGDNYVKEAALDGWTPDQFAAWLRHQPEYTQSEEFQSKALGVASALGLISGSLPTMGAGVAPTNPNGAPTAGPPSDKRVNTPTGPVNPTTPMDVNPGAMSTPF